MWDAVHIVRPMPYTLFTFGQSELPYHLVVAAERPGGLVAVTRGEITITRPAILTPDNVRPEFEGFFEREEGDVADFLLARGMKFPHLKFDNRRVKEDAVTDSMEETIARIIRRLEENEEDRAAVLAAPHGLGNLAVLKYAVEKAVESAPSNIQELKERGMLP